MSVESSSTTHQQRGLRILCLDGGGVRGIATCQMLREIERQIAPMKLHEFFDVISGTSTGAMIAVGLVCLSMTVDEIESMYRNCSKF
jgi:calcium-independent phospholipase A2-gamma